MCLGFMLYYPRQELADCRSLPTLSTVMSALGIESIHGKSFDKLAVFLKDLGGISSDGKLSNHTAKYVNKDNMTHIIGNFYFPGL